jgi:hypothetical protein
MKRVMVRYRVKPDRVAENESLVRAVYAELHAHEPEGIAYATFKLADGVSFVHIAESDTPDGRSPLLDLPAFGRFLEGIPDRCEEPPVTSELTAVGAFRIFE